MATNELFAQADKQFIALKERIARQYEAIKRAKLRSRRSSISDFALAMSVSDSRDFPISRPEILDSTGWFERLGWAITESATGVRNKCHLKPDMATCANNSTVVWSLSHR
jgi:hypothetical protein